MATWSKESLLNFIEAYRSHECLWRIKSKEYSNRTLREKRYQELVSYVKTFEPDANKDFVIKKISNLRNAFRKQLKKIDSWKLSGSGADECEPTLWYFHALEFLRDQEVPRPAQSNTEPDIQQQAEPQYDFEEDTVPTQMVVEIDVADSPTSDSLALNDSVSRSITPVTTPTTAARGASASTSGNTSANTIINRPAKRKAVPADTCNQLLTLARDRLLNPPKTNVLEEDEFDSFGKTIAHKLRIISREQNIHAQKLISDILYDAELGTLSRSTVVYNSIITTPQPHPQMDFDVYRSYDHL